MESHYHLFTDKFLEDCDFSSLGQVSDALPPQNVAPDLPPCSELTTDVCALQHRLTASAWITLAPVALCAQLTMEKRDDMAGDAETNCVAVANTPFDKS